MYICIYISKIPLNSRIKPQKPNVNSICLKWLLGVIYGCVKHAKYYSEVMNIIRWLVTIWLE